MAGSLGKNFLVGAHLQASVGTAFASLKDKIRATQQSFRNTERQSSSLGNVIVKHRELADAMRRAREQAASAGLVEKSLADSITRLSREYGEAARRAGVYGQSIQEITRRQRELTQEAQRSQAQLRNMQRVEAGRELRQSGHEQRSNAYGQMTGMYSAAMSAAAPLKIGMDFEAQMSQVQAISRASGEDLEKLRAQARELGATTVWSAKEAAQGMSFLAMAGFKTNETMAAMPGMLSLASAAGQDLGRTADIASNILSGMGFSADQMGYVGDVLAKTFTSSNTTLSSLGESMKYAAPIARTTGQSFQDLAAMVGKLGDAGIQGSMAGTALNAMLVRISAPPEEAANALKFLGISTRDAEGNLRKMPDLLREIGAKTSKMGTGVKAEFMAKLFGMENVKAAAILAEQALTGELQKMSANLNEKGFSDKLSKVQTNNLAGDLKALQSASEEVALCFYDAVGPALRQLTQSLTGIVQPIGVWIKANPQLVQGLMLVVGALAALKTAGIAFAILGGYRRSFVGGMESMRGRVGLAIGSVTGSFGRLRAALMQPVGVSVAGAQAGLQSFKARLSSLGATAGSVINRLRQIGPASIAAGTKAAVGGTLAATGRAGFNVLRLGIKGVGMAFKTMFGPMSLVMMGLSIGADYIMEHWDEIQPYFEALWEGIKNIFNSVMGWLQPIIDKIMGFIGPMVDKIKGLLSGLGKAWNWITGNDKKVDEKVAEQAANKDGQNAAVQPSTEAAVKTQAQLQEEQQWAEQYATKDFQEEKEAEKAKKKADREAEKAAKKAARQAEREAKKKEKKQKSGKEESFDWSRGMEQMNAMPDNYSAADDDLDQNLSGNHKQKRSAAPAQNNASRSASPAALATAAQGPAAGPQVQVAVNITQNGVPDRTFAQGVVNAIRNEGQAAIQEIIDRIVGDQARLAYGG